MSTFTVNNKVVSGPPAKKLLAFLREDLGLTASKNGCGSGACGACTVLVDGKAVCSCVLSLAKLEGKQVVTLEGLSEREKEVYSYAFGKAGAVQCGFCIPGMVMSAKATLDQNPNPTEIEIRKAIRSNICRCTGYVKIVEAIKIAARCFRENLPVVKPDSDGKVGDGLFRVDAAAKTLGTARYADDLTFDGMLYASALRAGVPRARINSIDAAAALAHPDCVAVFTAKDVPGNNKIGHLEFLSDYDVMIQEGSVSRFIADALAVVVCKHKESLDEVKALVKVDKEVLEPLTSPQAAMAEGAPLIHSNKARNILSHEHLVRGDAAKALAASKYVVHEHFSTPFTEHAFMEPECAVALPEGKDGVHLYSGGQGIYDEQRECSRMLGIPPEKVHVTSMVVGGGFGGKEDMSVQHHACLAAWLLKKPVKVLLSRQESINLHPKRHAMEMDFSVGCDENGILQGMKAEIVSDTGAYASLGGPVLQRACTHAAGPYNYQNIDIDGKAVYTNNIPGGAFRGFGCCQSNFAMESCMDLLAEKAGISPWEIRWRNAVHTGDSLPNGQITEMVDLDQCLLAVKEVYEKARADGKAAGISCAFKNAGVGVGLEDVGRCILSVEQGLVHIRCSAAGIGQGVATVLTQICCQVTGLHPSKILYEHPDTQRTPDSGTTTASRQTAFSGEAARLAAQKLKAALDKAGGKLEQLEGQEFKGEFSFATDPISSKKPNPVSHLSYGYAATVAVLDQDGRVEKLTAAYDIGQVVNPIAAQGQIEGGLLMGMGYALTEDFPMLDGYPKAKYGTLGLIRATEAPPMDVIFVEPKQKSPIACGAKGVGELATIPVCPAITGAYYARDGILRTRLPIEHSYYRK